MFIMLILTGLIITGLKRSRLIPVIIFCQASAITIVCARMGLEVPLVVLAFTVKALIIPLVLYYIVRKTIVFGQEGSILPASMVVALVLAIFVAADLFVRQLNGGPFAMASIFTVLIGILLITSRKTMVSQLTGFIVLQNGIFAFSSSFCLKVSFALELLLAMDVLLTVLIMAYAIRTIHKTSGNINIETFSALRG